MDQLSAADIMLSFPAEIAIRMGRADDFAALASFVKEMQARPAYQRAVEQGNC
ncbi:hypothetical protein [Sulfitobacter sediminilitoris]